MSVFFSSRRRHTRSLCDWSSDVCSSDLAPAPPPAGPDRRRQPIAIHRCGWCGKTLGLAPEVPGDETTGICEVCSIRFEAEAALSHALVAVRAIAAELERALAGLQPPHPPG